MDRHFGVAASVFSEDATEEVAGGWADVSDAKFAFFALRGAADGFKGGQVLINERAGLSEECGSGFGEADAFAVAVEEDGAEFVLHFFDCSAECGLCDAEAHGGLGEAKFFGDGDELPELP